MEEAGRGGGELWGGQGDGGAYQRGENVAERESIAFWKIKSCILHPPSGGVRRAGGALAAPAEIPSSPPLLPPLPPFHFDEETQTSTEETATALSP